MALKQNTCEILSNYIKLWHKMVCSKVQDFWCSMLLNTYKIMDFHEARLTCKFLIVIGLILGYAEDMK